MRKPNTATARIEDCKRLCDIFSEVWSAKMGLICFSSMNVLHMTDSLIQETYLGIDNETQEYNSVEIFKKVLHPKEIESITLAHLQSIKHFTKLYRKKGSPPFAAAKYYFKIKVREGIYEDNLAFIHPIAFSELGLPLLSCFLLRPEQKVGAEKFSITSTDNQQELCFSEASNKYIPKENLELKPIECRILELTAKGFGEVKIAKTLEIKLDLLRYYKKSIYKKYHISNMTEAVYTAIKNKDIVV